MPDLVSDGTSFSCPFCTDKLTLAVASSSAEGDGKKLANISNSLFPPPGGQCLVIPSAPAPCVPSVTVVEPGQSGLEIDDKSALGAGCQFMCAKGGVLTVSSSGQAEAKHDEVTSADVLAVLEAAALLIFSRGSKKPSATSLKSGVKLLRVIKNYLKHINKKTKKELVKDLKSMGLKVKGKSPDGKFMEFEDKKGRPRVKIHPPDSAKSKYGTKYDHIHIYDKKANPLDSSLKIGNKNSPDVHIEYGGD